MRVASIALLALLAGAYAAIDTQFELHTLKKSEFNSNTFFAEFTIYASATGACGTTDVGDDLLVKNAVGGPVTIMSSTTTIINSEDADCDPVVNDDDCAQNFPWVPNKIADEDHCVATYTAALELEAVVDYHNFPFDYQNWVFEISAPYSADTYAAYDQVVPKHYFHIDGWRDIRFDAWSGEETNAVTGDVVPTFTYTKTVRREFTYFLSKFGSNIILLVIMSLFTAFLPVNDSIRILLNLLVFIAIIFWQIVIADKLPSAAYPNWFDSFSHVSFAFIFSQFLYYTVHKAVYKEDDAEKTLGEDAADVPAGLSSAKKVDIAVHVVFGLIYFIAVASVLGVATNVDG